MKLSLELLAIAATIVAAAPAGNFVEKRASCTGMWAAKDLDARSIELRNEACPPGFSSPVVKRATCNGLWAAKDLDARLIEFRNEACPPDFASRDLVEKRAGCNGFWAAKDSINGREVECIGFASPTILRSVQAATGSGQQKILSTDGRLSVSDLHPPTILRSVQAATGSGQQKILSTDGRLSASDLHPPT